MLNLSTILEDSARRYPDKDAFIFMDRQLTYQQVNSAANQLANALISIGIQPGDKIGLSCLNLPYFPIVYFGILKAGAVIVPLSVLLKRDEITYHLHDSDAKVYFCFEGTPELPMVREGHAAFERVDKCKHFFVITGDPAAASPIESAMTLGQLMARQSASCTATATNPDDTAVIVYTSGTTGRPKGAELTHSNLLLNAMLCGDTRLMGLQPDDVLLTVLPLFHIFAMTVMMNAGIFRGSSNVLVPRFEPAAVLGLMQQHKVTVFAGVPTMYWGLLNHKGTAFDPKAIAEKLRLCLSGGASLPVQVLEDFEAKFKVPILEGYGMSEGSPVVTFNQPERERKPGSIGTPVWGVEVKIVDHNDREVGPNQNGQLLYRGHNVMKGYYKRPEANAESLKGGWMHSGDVAYRDEDGYYFIVDRTKDMIIRGGLNVYPREVEETIMKHEAVSLVAIIGVPHDEYGEEIKAFVVPKEGRHIDPQQLIEWTKERIAAYKYPRIVEIVDSLPMSATGKILKKILRQQETKA